MLLVRNFNYLSFRSLSFRSLEQAALRPVMYDCEINHVNESLLSSLLEELSLLRATGIKQSVEQIRNTMLLLGLSAQQFFVLNIISIIALVPFCDSSLATVVCLAFQSLSCSCW